MVLGLSPERPIQASINTGDTFEQLLKLKVMKLRIVRSKNEILELSPNERIGHLAIGPSNVDFLSLMTRCPHLRAIQVPPSYHKTKAITFFPEMREIELLEGDVWGYGKDIDEYFIVYEEMNPEIEAVIASGASIGEDASQIAKRTGLASDQIEFIARSKAAA